MKEPIEASGNRMCHAPTKKQGGRFGKPEEQRTGKSGRGGMNKATAKLTIDDYDKVKI